MGRAPQQAIDGARGRRPAAPSRTAILALVFVAQIGLTSALVPGYFDVWGLLDATRAFAEVGLIALGMTLVILTGGIDLSVHAHHIVSYVTGLDVEEVSAELTTFAERREVYDNSYVHRALFGRREGAHLGQLHGLGQRPRVVVPHLRREGRPDLAPGGPGGAVVQAHRGAGDPPGARLRGPVAEGGPSHAAPRRPPGGLCAGLRKPLRRLRPGDHGPATGRDHRPYLGRVPGIDDGVAVMVIDAAIRSHDAGGSWTRVPRSRP